MLLPVVKSVEGRTVNDTERLAGDCEEVASNQTTWRADVLGNIIASESAFSDSSG